MSKREHQIKLNMVYTKKKQTHCTLAVTGKTITAQTSDQKSTVQYNKTQNWLMLTIRFHSGHINDSCMYRYPSLITRISIQLVWVCIGMYVCAILVLNRKLMKISFQFWSSKSNAFFLHLVAHILCIWSKERKKKKFPWLHNSITSSLRLHCQTHFCVHEDDQRTGGNTDSVQNVGFIVFFKDPLLILIGRGFTWERAREDRTL